MLSKGLLCDDDAFHPRMDVAVVVVRARLSEGKGVSPTVLRHVTVNRWEASVQRGIGRYSVQYASIVLPDYCGAVYRCVV